jgi:hypothetical protein
MYPAPPAALQLAQRLRQLRESWPRLTQKKLAAAFSTEEKLAAANPDFTELHTYADIDVLMELHGHIRAENPTATVHFRTLPEVEADNLTGHLAAGLHLSPVRRRGCG